MNGEENFPGWAWLFMVLNGLFLAGLLLTAGCIDIADISKPTGGSIDPEPSDLKAMPEVNVTTVDYYGDPYSLPHQGVHNRFSAVYSGSDLDIALRNKLIDVMEDKAFNLNENGTILRYCIEETYEDMDQRPNRIPTYAEKCLWNDEDVWAVAFNRCNGWEDGIGHFDLYYISIQDIEHIYVTGCYGCNSTSPILAEYHCR
jgi:hypothetical protein